MENLIQVSSKQVYGVQKFYPFNTLGAQLAEFKNQSTLTQRDIKDLKDMGFRVQLVAEVPGNPQGATHAAIVVGPLYRPNRLLSPHARAT